MVKYMTSQLSRPRIVYLFILVAILGVGLILRTWGISFGLPYEYHVDEDQYVRQAASMGAAGLKPADWFNPPFFKYLLLVEYGAFFLVGKVLGWFASTADFGARLSLDPTGLYLLARGTSALLGSLTVLIVAWIGTKAYTRTVGLFSAGLMAVAFLPVRESHFAVNDAVAAFLVSLALLAGVGIHEIRRVALVHFWRNCIRIGLYDKVSYRGSGCASNLGSFLFSGNQPPQAKTSEAVGGIRHRGSQRNPGLSVCPSCLLRMCGQIYPAFPVRDRPATFGRSTQLAVIFFT